VKLQSRTECVESQMGAEGDGDMDPGAREVMRDARAAGQGP
jgi:hypothetical protein